MWSSSSSSSISSNLKSSHTNKQTNDMPAYVQILLHICVYVIEMLEFQNIVYFFFYCFLFATSYCHKNVVNLYFRVVLFCLASAFCFLFKNVLLSFHKCWMQAVWFLFIFFFSLNCLNGSGSRISSSSKFCLCSVCVL